MNAFRDVVVRVEALEERAEAVEARTDVVEQRERARDVDLGILTSVDASVTALTNGHAEIARFMAEQRGHNRMVRAQLARASALPLALIANQLGVAVDGAQGTASIASMLSVLAVALFAPELLDKMRKRAAGEPEPEEASPVDDRRNGAARPRGSRGNGKHHHHDEAS